LKQVYSTYFAFYCYNERNKRCMRNNDVVRTLCTKFFYNVKHNLIPVVAGSKRLQLRP